MDFGEIIHLPQANLTGGASLVESIAGRRSAREFTPKPLSIEQAAHVKDVFHFKQASNIA
jgi:hypothetical protein